MHERPRIGDLADNVTIKVAGRAKNRDTSYVGLEHLQTDNPLIQGSVPSAESISVNTVFRRDDTLFGKLRPNLRKVARADFDGYCSTDILVLRAKPDVDPSFLNHVLRSPDVLDYAANRAFGTKMPRTSWGDLRDLRISVPRGDEQKRVVATLDEVDAEILTTQRMIDKLGMIRLGLVDDALRGRTQANRAEKNTIWRSGPLSRWCTRMTVGVVNSATQAYVSEGVPFIRSQNVRPGRIDEAAMLFITESYNRVQSASILRAGDVVVVRTGYPGTAAVVPDSLDGANCFSLLVVTPSRRDLLPDYLSMYLNSETCKTQIGKLHFGSAQHNLNLGQLKRLEIAIPSIPAQEAIVRRESNVSQLILDHASVLRKLKLLRLGVLSDLTRGRLPRHAEPLS